MDKVTAKAPCRVKIIKCSYPKGWYRNLIGEEFETHLAPDGKDYVLWEDYINNHTTWRHIGHDDCIRLNSAPNDKTSVATGAPQSDEARNQSWVGPLSDEYQKCMWISQKQSEIIIAKNKEIQTLTDENKMLKEASEIALKERKMCLDFFDRFMKEPHKVMKELKEKTAEISKLLS